jgi:hypothetical protein
MATAEKRFLDVPSEQEIDKLLTDKDSINKQKATDFYPLSNQINLFMIINI